METVIFHKVLDYLGEYVGEMAVPGTPNYNARSHQWSVAVLCRTERGTLPVGEFLLDEEGNFLSIPDRDVMLRILNAQLDRLPFLVYGNREELESKGVQVVAV